MMEKILFKNRQSLPAWFRALRVFLVLLVAVGIMQMMIFLKKVPEKNEVVETPPSVSVLVAKPISKTMIVDAYGTVKARKPVKLSVEVSGRVTALHPAFVEGGRVQKDDLLVQLDPETYQLNRRAGKVKVDQARTDIENFKQDMANLEQDLALSRENLELAEKELDRVRALVENQFISKTILDQTKQKYLQAKMQVQGYANRLSLTDTALKTKQAALAMARVDFQQADLALKRTRIKAAIDGFVLEKRVETGEFVSPGQTLGVIYASGQLDVEVRIPLEKTRWLNGISEGEPLPMVEIQVANDALEHPRTWKGQVARLKARIDEQTRTLPLIVEILSGEASENSVFDLKPGSFVKCTIMGQSMDDLYVIPRSLLKTGDVLFIVNNARLEMRSVTVLRKFEEDVYITHGLKPGDKIVSSPLPGALEGMALSIMKSGYKK